VPRACDFRADQQNNDGSARRAARIEASGGIALPEL
jgi:hypothetical protein